MNIESFREYCLSKKAVSESFSFDKTALVLKVLDKMFALTDLENEFSISLKCNPEEAILLREKYEAVKGAYHFNKKHWNSVLIDGSISDKEIKEWIDDSYNLVVSKMTKKNRNEIAEM